MLRSLDRFQTRRTLEQVRVRRKRDCQPLAVQVAFLASGRIAKGQPLPCGCHGRAAKLCDKRNPRLQLRAQPWLSTANAARKCGSLRVE